MNFFAVALVAFPDLSSLSAIPKTFSAKFSTYAAATTSLSMAS
jgi:hypothetical protein